VLGISFLLSGGPIARRAAIYVLRLDISRRRLGPVCLGTESWNLVFTRYGGR